MDPARARLTTPPRIPPPGKQLPPRIPPPARPHSAAIPRRVSRRPPAPIQPGFPAQRAQVTRTSRPAARRDSPPPGKQPPPRIPRARPSVPTQPQFPAQRARVTRTSRLTDRQPRFPANAAPYAHDCRSHIPLSCRSLRARLSSMAPSYPPTNATEPSSISSPAQTPFQS
jgi:hypothetical protein